MSKSSVAVLTREDYIGFAMMNFGNFGLGGGMMFFGWIIPVIVVVLLVLGIAALWKYINKK
ncbi:hypothetical protein COU76_05990 [Candidatus Peregrinibacteria bacterium CG10_big_fil_rev_8_21_14_0_10_49_10]|nr:MAG: hypothetical protein COU76_05990 [Candidatus Peregrinibacteria bacterium CG10_big_fil_rev_8_21_14_0_10_49_10]